METTAKLVEPLKAVAKTKSSTIVADYPVVELSGRSRLILSIGQCGRVFGVELPEPLGEGEPLPDRAELVIPSLDETGCPQGATFKRFLIK